MTTRRNFIIFAITLTSPGISQDAIDVFRAGERGYASFRIPAIVQLQDGALLAFAEGRVAGRSDAGDIDIVLKRSADGGATWGPLQVVADNGPGVFGNPAPVVERESGDVVLVCVRQPEGCHERQIRGGEKGYRDPYVMRSTGRRQTVERTALHRFDLRQARLALVCNGTMPRDPIARGTTRRPARRPSELLSSGRPRRSVPRFVPPLQRRWRDRVATRRSRRFPHR